MGTGRGGGGGAGRDALFVGRTRDVATSRDLVGACAAACPPSIPQLGTGPDGSGPAVTFAAGNPAEAAAAAATRCLMCAQGEQRPEPDSCAARSAHAPAVNPVTRRQTGAVARVRAVQAEPARVLARHRFPGGRAGTSCGGGPRHREPGLCWLPWCVKRSWCKPTTSADQPQKSAPQDEAGTKRRIGLAAVQRLRKCHRSGSGVRGPRRVLRPHGVIGTPRQRK